VLGQNYSNGSILSVDMDVVGITAAYLPVVCVCGFYLVHRYGRGWYYGSIFAGGVCVCVCTAHVQYTQTHTITYLCICWIIKCFNRH
jgi:hypothetical protein